MTLDAMLPPRLAIRFPANARQRAVAACAVLAGFGLLAVVFGQSNSWDLHNYHLYNGWAFWTGRGDRDFAAAQLQTYFNPLLATATYLLFVNTPPWLSTFVLGAVQGVNCLLVYALARRLLPQGPDGRRTWLAAIVALIGVVGATQISELGGSMGDNLVSIPILGALVLVLQERELDTRRAMIAGLLAGLTTGVKLTTLPFLAGLIVGASSLAWPHRNRWRVPLAMGAAAVTGFLATDAFWLVHLYREFGNPMHPMFSGVFGGAYVAPMPVRDARFLPAGIAEWLFYPLVWVTAPHRVSDTWFFDLRIPLAFLLAPLLSWRCASIDRRRELALLQIVAIAYVLWLWQFSVYRYIAPIEMLAPLLVVLALMRLPMRSGTIAAAVLLPIMVVCVRPPGWGHLHDYGAKYLDIQIPPVPGLADATVIFAEDDPLAFLALGFPATTRFVRIGGNLLGPPYPPYAMDREAARRIAAADGALYAILLNPGSAQVAAVMARQQLTLGSACLPIRSNILIGAAQLCPVRRPNDS